MLKVIEQLIECGRYGKKVKKGNHAVFKCGEGTDYYYHDTIVCKVDLRNQQIIFDDGGYSTNRSTTRILKDYFNSNMVQQYLYQGYELVDRTGSNIGGILKEASKDVPQGTELIYVLDSGEIRRKRIDDKES